jgi:aspartyl-tRNA(Asn)/glutamyl-tRNA(Gln) amidotransferase subunit A
MSSVASLTAWRDDLDKGRVSSVELTQSFLQRIEKKNKEYNAFRTVTPELALAQASAADKTRARGGETPSLCGIPIAHKDLFCMQGAPTTCASRMLEHYVSPYDAMVVERLRASGAVVLGKTNMDEFAMGSSNENSAFGPVRNPWDTERVPGGSSGGSAAAVAGGLCAAATATDTGGSARQPAALCGLTALKPSYGRVSRYGMVAFASSLDQASTLTHSAEDAAHLFSAMAGHDRRDSTCIDKPVDDYLGTLNKCPALRIGIVEKWLDGAEDTAQAVESACKLLEGAGHKTQRVDLPNILRGLSAYYVLASAECASNLARYDGVRYGYRCKQAKSISELMARSRTEGFGSEVQRRILLGTFVLSAGYYDAYYRKAQQLRRVICEEFRRAFEQVDVLIGATTVRGAFHIGQKTSNPVDLYKEDLYTVPANLAGLPAMSVPVGVSDGLPLGMHMVAPYLQEARLLGLAHQFQTMSDWHGRAPVAN